MAERYGFSLAQLSIAWCLKNEAVQSMLIGPTSTQELISYMQALQVGRILILNHLHGDVRELNQ